MSVEVEVRVRDHRSWEVHFQYHPGVVAAVKRIGGAKFIPKEKGGPAWRLPASIESYERLVEQVAPGLLNFDPAIVRWYKGEIRNAKRLRRMAAADTATLTTLPDLNPGLHDFVSSRGYQLADIRFMAHCQHPLNFNQPGTGKTVETIGSIYEAGLDDGPVLVVAPLGALGPTWQDSISAWVGDVPVAVAGAREASTGRVTDSVIARARAGEAVWVCLNPEAVKINAAGKCMHPWIYEVDWNVIVIDEFHRMGLSNPETLFHKSIKKLRADKKILLSGTPIGGQPIKLWGPLHFLYPDKFPSKWAFANNWFQIHDNGFGQEIGDVLKHRRDEFNDMISQYAVRRLKSEIMQWLPPKQYVDLWVPLDGKQRKQYDEWEKNTEIEIDEAQLDALSILAVYTRLRQFANAVQMVEWLDDERFKLMPTDESAKLPVMWELLEERDIDDLACTEKVVIFSQFTTYVNVVAEWLRKKLKHAEVGVITGETKVAERNRLVRTFNSDPALKIMLMNTQAGGVSITLDAADTVIFLDQTWNPDDQEQAEDRAHRGTKDRQVMVYRILTKDTIEERIFKGNVTKETINRRVLDHKINP